MKKRIVSLLLAAFMMFSLVPFSFAEGEANACAHENAHEEWCWVGPVEYESIDEETHRASGYYATFLHCPDCGERVDYTEQEEIRSEVYQHSFTEDNICSQCGYQPQACEHTAVEESWGWLGEPTYTSIDEQQHEISGQYYTHLHCKECGYEFERQEFSDIRTMVEAHSFDINGLCNTCGYQKEDVCAHENIEEQWKWVDREPEFVYRDTGDASAHEVTGNAVVTQSCSNCGYVFGAVSERRTETEPHVFEGGICVYCGHEAAPACQHANTRTEEFEDGYSYRDFGDNRYHEVYVINVTVTICEDCGAELSREEDENLYSANSAHEYRDGVCTQCTHVNTCTHENAEENWDWVDWSANTYESVDNRYHIVTGAYYTQRWCPDCEHWIDYQEYTEPRVETNSHDYDENGVCRQCNHENTCAHENTYTYWNWKDWAQCAFIDTDSNTEHEVSGTIIRYIYCNDCGQYVEQWEEEHAETQSHDYDENGVCRQCNHVNTCAHENAEENWGWLDQSSNTFAAVDNRYHTETGAYYSYRWCPDCGITFDRQEQTELRTETNNHNYNENGICANCGHENTCTHENAEENWDWVDWSANTYESVDNRDHIMSGQIYTYRHCPDCGITFDRQEQAEPRVETYNHNYNDNGICANCGHVNTCTHENAEENWDWVDWSANTYESVDNRDHIMSGQIYTYRHCLDCGITFDRQEQAELYTVTQGHDYDDNGVCRQCRHENTCTHENAEEYWNWVDWDSNTYESVDNRDHVMSGRIYTYRSCPDCGISFDRQEQAEPHAETNNHNYNDNGVCVNCGHVNTCTHENAEENWDWVDWSANTYESVDNRSHTVTGAYYTYRRCLDCGITFDRHEQAEPHTETNNHNYDDNGECANCGHVNTCTHENAEENWGWVDSNAIIYESVDNRYHTATGTYFTQRWCPDCYITFDYQEQVEPRVETYSHSYDENGVCQICNHVNTCTHENAEENWDWVDWSANTYESVDNRCHTVTGAYYTQRWCPDCEQWIDYQEHTEPRIETYNHDYDDNGVCRDCNHVNTCPHENTHTDWNWKNWDQCVFVDTGSNTEHEVSGTIIRYINCNDCGQYVEQWEEEYTQTQGHDYDNGVCRQCNHVNTCPHENAEEHWGWNDSNATYTAVDNQNHEVTVTKYFTYLYCEDCGQQINRVEHTEPRTETFRHNYDNNGVCQDCGYVNTCTHENAYDPDWWWLDSNAIIYESVDNRYHTVTGTYYTHRWCPDCECWIDYQEHTEPRTETYRHNYDENGICLQCNHINTCTHENAYDPDWWWLDSNAIIYEPVDNRCHTVTGAYYTQRWCPDCECWTDYQEHTEPRTETYSHNYDENGVCRDCNHVNTCTHENAEERWGWVDWSSNTFESVDNRWHTVTGAYYTQRWCPDCECWTDYQEHTEPRTETYSHNYDENGVCQNCNHENTCDHAYAHTWGYFIGEANVPMSYEDTGDNVNHLVTGEYYRQTDCNTCGWSFHTISIETMEERHSYSENGVCQDCGHVNTCLHEHKKTYRDYSETSDYTEIPGNNLEHSVIQTTYYYERCRDCMMTLRNWSEQATITETHYYDDGVCEACGHVNTCTHEHTHSRNAGGEYFDAVEIPGNNLMHNQQILKGHEEFCDDCGIFMRYWEDEELSNVKRRHSYENGKCVACGHVNTCTHENAQANEWIDSNSATCESINDRYHLATGLGERWVYCDDCGTDVSYESGIQMTKRQYHSYDEDGVCYYCGHVNTCTHENVYSSWWWIDYDGNEYESLDNRSHIVTGHYYTYRYCEDCGMEFDRVEHEETRIAVRNHDYDAHGVCQDCGHVNTCEHLNTRESESISNYQSATFEPIDNTYHRVTGTGTSSTYCVDCGQNLNTQPLDTLTAEYSHDYDANGVCRYCGHVNTCTHEHLETYAWYNGIAVEIDGATHSFTGDEGVAEWCHDCAYYKQISQTYVTNAVRSHNFYNGVCEQCGAKIKGWLKIDNYWFYYSEDGELLIGWQYINGKWYYFDQMDGTMLTGWQSIGGKWYYFNSSGAMMTGWQSIGGKWYYFNSSGAMLTGWQTIGGKWYYFDSFGAMITGWQAIGGKWYYFDGSGVMQTGWQHIGGQWYYFYSSGAMVTGWQTIGEQTYWFNTSGAMQKGWLSLDGKWYYFDSSGAMTTGWQTIGEQKYYFDASGAMVTGWQTIGEQKYWFNTSGAMQKEWLSLDGKWYYFDSSGAMVTGLQTIGGQTYCFNASGVMQTGWQLINNKWYYFAGSGAMVTGWQYIGGKWYYFESTGVMATGWKLLSGKWYYLGTDGAMATGWRLIDNIWYYFETSGVMLANTTKTINGKAYTFNTSGACTNP